MFCLFKFIFNLGIVVLLDSMVWIIVSEVVVLCDFDVLIDEIV